ncbi:hypothetical protein ACX6XY_27275 [Streptomyces sp. O3]
MPTPEHETRAPALSMKDLLASCAAASAVSTPPRPPRRNEESGPKAAAASVRLGADQREDGGRARWDAA